MNEEEKKAVKLINNFIEYFNKNIQDGNKADLTILGEEIEAIKTILNLIEKQQKKDDIIHSIREYVQQEIAFATEDIEDYIDDDREGNKNIIGELKEWREHWKDIIRIMNNEKTYMDFLYKIQV